MKRLLHLTLLGAFFAAPVLGAERPNIVIIYADDMGIGDMSITNPDSKIPTPHLDKLAEQGTIFTDGHSSSGICTPSRYALLTGRYHWRSFHGIVTSWGDSVFEKEDLTLPEMLQQQGYTTACIGKWHLGWDWTPLIKPGAEMRDEKGKKTWPADALDWSKPIPNGPLDHGFDYYFGDDVPNFPPYAWIENDRILEAPTVPYVPDPVPTEGNPEGRPGPMVEWWQQDQVMPVLTKKVVEWIGEQKGKEEPFFLFFPWTSPHAPIVPTKEWQGKTEAGGYGDFMAESDWCAGELLNALDANGFTENTLVIFTADNGPEHYAYPRVENTGHRSMRELRGLKRDIYEGGHRVPFVVRWPGKVPAGATSDELISQIDLMATLAAITGAELPDDAAQDSFDQLDLLLGNGASTRDHHIHNTYEGSWAIRVGDWTLVDAKTGYRSKVPAWFREANGHAEDHPDGALFHIHDDPAQRENLIGENAEVAEQLRTQLTEIRERGHSAPRLQ